MSKAKFDERMSVSFTSDQVRRLEEISRVRSRRGEPVNKSDVVRFAVVFYLEHQEDLYDSRKAIAKSVEGRIAEVESKLAAVDNKVERVGGLVTEVVQWIRRQRQ